VLVAGSAHRGARGSSDSRLRNLPIFLPILEIDILPLVANRLRVLVAAILPRFCRFPEEG
jgi:hypothetical protein